MPSHSELPEPLLSTSIDDRLYELRERICPNCETPHLEIWRWCGLSFSRYHMSEGFDRSYFQTFVEQIDEMLLMRSCDVFGDFFQDIMKVNSPAGIEADGSYAFRLLEYARHRCALLKKAKLLDAVTSEEEPSDEVGKAIRVAFELGMATAEHRIINVFEDYVYDGMALEDWRESGLPKAREERLRQGARTREAVIKAAKRVYILDRLLVRNDVETARRILKLDLPELQKGRGLQIGIDAVTRHLRAARRNDLL
jgi:hypothetical protein